MPPEVKRCPVPHRASTGGSEEPGAGSERDELGRHAAFRSHATMSGASPGGSVSVSRRYSASRSIRSSGAIAASATRSIAPSLSGSPGQNRETCLVLPSTDCALPG
jgi:hypothetical protein